MSWLFSRALVEASLGASSLDGTPSAQSSGTPTPQAYCAPDKMTDFSRPSRFGMTFAPLTADRGADVLTWCLADSLARTLVQPEGAQESKATEADCGPSSHGSFAKFDRDSCSWKTAQCSLLGGLDEFSETWPRWGSMRDGACWQRPTLARPISEIASGLWPTPNVPNGGRSIPKDAEVRLNGQTPTAYHNGKKMQVVLEQAVRWWPNASDNRGRGSDLCVQRANSPVGSLNPTWVEWLMGWPLGWTDLQPSATDKFRNVQPMRGAA